MAPANERPDRAIGRRAIRLGTRAVVVTAADAEWLEAFGSVFAHLHEVHGRVVAVPVSH